MAFLYGTLLTPSNFNAQHNKARHPTAIAVRSQPSAAIAVRGNGKARQSVAQRGNGKARHRKARPSNGIAERSPAEQSNGIA